MRSESKSAPRIASIYRHGITLALWYLLKLLCCHAVYTLQCSLCGGAVITLRDGCVPGSVFDVRVTH